ncbi:L-threonylcarbamoyladenylate synthase [Pseudidiomarina insulisalsae]|nr:L-threonylcarbamoyladenylate synthase [Pseudidiomarina insulisalsae]
MTLLFNADNEKELQHVGRLLQLGGVVAIPTETVYGLAADASNVKAIQRVYEAKNRPADHPSIVHIGRVGQLTDWAVEIPDAAYQLAEAFWPGPLTLLLQRHPHVSPLVTGGGYGIGVRLPAQRHTRKILSDFNLAVIAPSANMHQQLSPVTAAQVMQQLDGRIDAVLDGGRCDVGIESTIVDVREGTPRILRPGLISAEQIAKVLGVEVETPVRHRVSVAGNQARHYQPRTPLEWYQVGAVLTDNDVVLVREPLSELGGRQIALGGDPEAYAHELYHTLYELDQQGLARILVAPLPQDPAWLPLTNRLERAVTA